MSLSLGPQMCCGIPLLVNYISPLCVGPLFPYDFQTLRTLQLLSVLSPGMSYASGCHFRFLSGSGGNLCVAPRHFMVLRLSSSFLPIMELQHCEHWRYLCAGTPGVKCWLSFIIFAHFKEALLSTWNFEKFTLSIFKAVKFCFLFFLTLKQNLKDS